MTTVQIVCLIGIMAMCFVIGRHSKRWKVPIMGTLIFNGDEPKLVFKCQNFKEIQEHKYIAIEIKSRQNQQL